MTITAEILREPKALPEEASVVESFSSPKQRGNTERLCGLLVFGISLCYLCIFRHFSARDLDEGIILQAAERVLRGQIPYRDFFLFYTPGSVYIQAALFKLCGDSFLVARTAIAFIGAICSTFAYSLARRTCSRKTSLFAAAISTIIGVTYRFAVVHNWYSTLSAMLAIYAAVRLLETGSRSWAFLTGSLASATVLIEQSKGAGLCAGFLLGYLILHFLPREKTEFRLVASMTGFIWPCLLTVLYFGSHHALGVMLQHWFWPLAHYTQANHVPYGHLSWSEGVRNNLYAGPIALRISEIIALSPLLIIPILPLAALVLLAWWTRQIWVTRELTRQTAHYVLVSAMSAGLLLSILIVRTDITDFIYVVPLWCVILAFVLDRPHSDNFPSLQRLRPYALAYFCVSFGALGFALLLSVNGAPVRTQTRRGLILTANEENTIPALQRLVPADGQLLVYPYLPLYNYLTQTHSPARLDFFQSGMNTREQAQSIIEALESGQTPWVLFDPAFVGRIHDVWPRTPLGAIADDPVGLYIARHYRVCQLLRAGPGLTFHLMTLKNRSCMASSATNGSRVGL